MTNQGLFGALEQYWRVEPKARLNRRNTYFRDEFRVTEEHLLAIAIISLTGVIGIMAFFMVLGLVMV